MVKPYKRIEILHQENDKKKKQEILNAQEIRCYKRDHPQRKKERESSF
jgi:hypothetical protein